MTRGRGLLPQVIGLTLLCSLAIFAPLLAAVDPYDLAVPDLADAHLPPLSLSSDSARRYWLGTDAHGRDLFSHVLFGLRQSLWIGGVAVTLAALIGVGLGLLAGYAGGWVDAAIMRISDIQLALPPLLVAMMLSGIARGWLGPSGYAALAPWLIVAAIALSDWVLFARTVRAAVMGEMRKDYVDAAVAIGVGPVRVLLRHILPNVLQPVLVIAMLSLPAAIVVEATLSFLGAGLPATLPSLGTMIARGQSELHSGIWWPLVFPAGALIAISLCINSFAAPRKSNRLQGRP